MPRREARPVAAMPVGKQPHHGATTIECLAAFAQGELKMLVALLFGDLLDSCGTSDRISNPCKLPAPICESGSDRSNVAVPFYSGGGREREMRLSALGGVRRREQQPLCNVNRNESLTCNLHLVAVLVQAFAGLAVFGGALARPFQRSGYRSRS